MRYMTRLVALAFLPALAVAQRPEPLRYTVDLADTANHVFAVTLQVDSLPKASTIFQFAATAPGTYQVMDIGRFVRGFEVLDRQGQRIASERVSTNQWQIAEPSRVRTIKYGVIGTRDTTVTEHPVYAMCGTTLRGDYALINGQAIFGFPRGMQAAPLSVRLVHPGHWTAGTALTLANGRYHADNFDHLVDSPILLGASLTRAQLSVTGVPVEIYVRSKSGQITAQQLRGAMSGMLYSAGAFIGKLPVNRYTFLYDFGDVSAGAWEHSYSSEYVLPDRPYTEAYGTRVTDIAAHEFFHIVTPLNLHSEIIEYFNFERPVASQHLWLYEGTTEWAAHKMQLESGFKMPEAYLADVISKTRADHQQYDTAFSLGKMSRTSYSDSGQAQYGNIYQRGAIVAGLLDIKLLEASKGEHGLRDLINQLTATYGKKKAFPEDSLFAIIERRTNPEVGDFFRRYVNGAEHPPVAEYYAKLGIDLVSDSTGMPARFEVRANPTPEQLRLRSAWLGKRVIIP